MAETEEAAQGRTKSAEDGSLVHALLDLGFALARRNNDLISDLLREFRLTAPLADALWRLNPDEAAPSMREMAAGLSCDPSTVTFLADRLQERGLVERKVNPANRRSTSLVLTPEGARVRRRLVEEMTLGSPIARLSEAEQRQLYRLLSKAMSSAEGSQDTR